MGDRPSLGGRVQILRQKTENYAQVLSFRANSQWKQRQINVLTRYEKINQRKKRLKRKIDKWCDHHKISNKNITKGEIPTALKNIQKKRIHKHLKNQQENHHQIKFLCSKIKAEFHLKSSLLKKDFLCWSKIFCTKNFKILKEKYVL